MSNENREITITDLFKTWWPLAITWILLNFEPQLFSSVISRYPNVEINLAAYGNISWMIPVFISSPIMLLQTASAALCKDIETFKKLRKFTYGMALMLTLIHLVVVSTPLYFFITRSVFKLPEEVVSAGRIGLLLMLPWAGSITYRRFHQGVLIRFGKTKRMGFGTILRVLADVISVVILSRINGISGLIIASASQGVGVFLEAVYVGIITTPIIRDNLKPSETGKIISWKEFVKYYTPLLLNSVLMILYSPMNTAAIGRMPGALASLATWPVVNSFVNLINNLSQACREVTLTYFRRENAYPIIRKFCLTIGLLATLLVCISVITPFSEWYYGNVVSIPMHLIPIARTITIILIPLGIITSFTYMYMGIVTYSGKTTLLLSSTIAQLIVVAIGLFLGIKYWPNEGVYIVAAVSTLSAFVQLIWMFFSNKPYMLEQRRKTKISLNKQLN